MHIHDPDEFPLIIIRRSGEQADVQAQKDAESGRDGAGASLNRRLTSHRYRMAMIRVGIWDGGEAEMSGFACARLSRPLSAVADAKRTCR
jgi:hypothetical protein